MRETRSSGSVEGVLSNGHPYSDSTEAFGHRRSTARANDAGGDLLNETASARQCGRRAGVEIDTPTVEELESAKEPSGRNDVGKPAWLRGWCGMPVSFCYGYCREVATGGRRCCS
jgi:hypothetical protein